MGIDVTEEVVTDHAVCSPQLFETVLADAPHPFARIDEIRVGTVKEPLLLEHPAGFGEKSRLQDRGVLRIQLLEAEIDITAVDAYLV